MTQIIVKHREKASVRFKMIVNMLPILGLMLFYFTHYIEGSYSFIIPLGLSLFWLLQSITISNLNNVMFNKIAVWWWVYLFLCITMVIIGLSSTNINFVISRLPIFIIPGMGYFVIKNYNKKESIVLLSLFALIFGVNLVYNIVLGFNMPDIFEEQESTELSIQFGVMMNIASTGFINVGVFLLGVLFMLFLLRKGLIKRLFPIMVAIPIGFYILFQNTRGTAIILLLVEIAGLLMAFFEPKGKKNLKPYYIGMGVGLVVLAFVLFIPIIEFVIQNLQSERLAERMNDLLDFKQSGGNSSQLDEGSFAKRLLLAQTSLNTFLSNPINFFIGIGDHTQSFGGDLVKSGIGGHSEFIDVAARYGIIGIIVFLNIIKEYFKLLKRLTFDRDIQKYVNIIFLIFILMGIFNNVFEPMQLMFLYIVFPIVIELTDYHLNFSM